MEREPMKNLNLKIKMAFDYVPEEVKREYRDKHFPEDLNRAKELGKRLVEEAKQRKNS